MLTIGSYRLIQPIAILFVASSRGTSRNCSSHAKKSKQPFMHSGLCLALWSSWLPAWALSDLQLDFQFLCAYTVLRQDLLIGNIIWHYEIKYERNIKPQSCASLQIQICWENRNTGHLNTTEIPKSFFCCPAWVKPSKYGMFSWHSSED